MKKVRLKKGERREIDWNYLVSDLVDNCIEYHTKFYCYNQFKGPSHHFHLRALTADMKSKPEMTYAMLVSWGMHRMGGGTQMNDFETFRNSIMINQKGMNSLKEYRLSDISEKDFEKVLQIFDNLNPMKSSKKIVRISKLMAHYLPDLIAPIDNEYNFKFVWRNLPAPQLDGKRTFQSPPSKTFQAGGIQQEFHFIC